MLLHKIINILNKCKQLDFNEENKIENIKNISENSCLNDLTVKEFLELKELIDNKHEELSNLSNVLKSVRNKRLVNELNYFDTIQEQIDVFQIGCNLSEDKYKFSYKCKQYAKTGKRWYCNFEISRSQYPFVEFLKVDIIHVPEDIRVGQRIEVIFNQKRFNTVIENNKFYDQFYVQRINNTNGYVSLRFEDPTKILEILNYLSYRIKATL